MRIKCTLTNRGNGQRTTVQLHQPAVPGGIWTITERARRAAFKRIGADHTDTNAGVTSSQTVRAYDGNGWHTFTIYPGPEMKPFTMGDWHAWVAVNGRNILLSDEATKSLRQFTDVDATVNWLFLNDHKDVARALNKHAKE